MDSIGKAGAGGEFAQQATTWMTPTLAASKGVDYMRAGDGSDVQILNGQVKTFMAANWATPIAQDSEQAGGAGTIARGNRGQTLNSQATAQWMTPNVPNGGRKLPAALVQSKGTTEDGQKRSVGLESQSRYWPTPDAGMYAGSNRSPSDGAAIRPEITLAAQQWPTPAQRDGDARRGATNPESDAWKNKVSRGAVNAAGMLSDDLTSSATHWPTPVTSDAKSQLGGGMKDRMDARTQAPSLSQVVTHSHSSPQAQQTTDGPESSPNTPNSPRHLSPVFASWLMGWPLQWTIAEPRASSASETELFRRKLASHLCCLLDG